MIVDEESIILFLFRHGLHRGFANPSDGIEFLFQVHFSLDLGGFQAAATGTEKCRLQLAAYQDSLPRSQHCHSPCQRSERNEFRIQALDVVCDVVLPSPSYRPFQKLGNIVQHLACPTISLPERSLFAAATSQSAHWQQALGLQVIQAQIAQL